MKQDSKNLILAFALSALIFIGWQYFYIKPMLKDKQRAAEQTQMAEQNAKNGGHSGVLPKPGASTDSAGGAINPMPGNADGNTGGAQPLVARETSIAASPRIKITTPKLTGSINLKGAKLDDLELKDYHETVDKKSPKISLLSPAGSKLAYFAEQGWVVPAGAATKVPDGNTLWTATDGTELNPDHPVTLSWDNGAGLVFKKTISIDDLYMFSIEQSVENTTGAPVSLYPYGRIQRQGLPKLQGIYVIHEGPIGVHDGSLNEVTYKNLVKDGSPDPVTSTGGWIGFTDKYWAVAAIPQQDDQNITTYRYIPNAIQDHYQTDFVSKTPVVVAAGGIGKFNSDLFAGAKVVKIITDYEDRMKIDKFNLLIDWGWFFFLTKPMFWLLHHIQQFIGNFGIAILVVTVLVKGLFFPLANMSYRSMSKMKLLQPEMQKIKERFPDDKVKQQQETMALYKNSNVSPLSGCLPMIVQIPVFFSLYKVIYVTIEMRHAPFYGWIQDLSAPDPTSIFNLFGLLPFTPPHILMIGVLPLIMGITMWIQMKLNPAPPDPVQAQIFNLMPIFFTFILAGFPSGLVLYWAWNNTLSIIQQATIMKRQGVDVNIMKNIRDSMPSFGRKNDK